MTPIYNHSREPDGAGRDTPDPQTLTLGSLFDGSGGFPLGGLLSGITPVWASEIEPFPIRVTTKRLPFMKHYGDVSRMDGGKIGPMVAEAAVMAADPIPASLEKHPRATP